MTPLIRWDIYHMRARADQVRRKSEARDMALKVWRELERQRKGERCAFIWGGGQEGQFLFCVLLWQGDADDTSGGQIVEIFIGRRGGVLEW